MTEILTESFCERCGTRYTFESAAPRKSRLGRVRVVSKGLRNFVMQDESTLSEAMADARSDEERAATAHQLDAFHKTFNFCMNCRQYTCGNCWNPVEGRCLTCSPVPGMELPEAPVVELPVGTEAVAAEAGAIAAEAVGTEAVAAEAEDLAPEAWPEADLTPDRLARAMGIASVAEAAEGAETGVDAAAGAAASLDAAGDAGALVEGPADAGVPIVPQVIGLAPGQSLEDALAAYEAQVAAEERAGGGAEADVTAETGPDGPAAAAGAAPAPEVVAPPAEAVATEVFVVAAAEAAEAEAPGAAAPEPEAGVEAEEPEAEVAAAAAVEAVEAAAPEPEPVEVEAAAAIEAAEPAPGPEAVVPAHRDVVEQPTWPVAAAPQARPEAAPQAEPVPGPVASPWLTVAPDDGAEPQWPASTGWANSPSGRQVPTTLAGRPLLPRDNAADLWAASAAEVLSGGPSPAGPASTAAATPATPQPCVNCGLSLSANARFCRRCGTRQG